MDADLFNLYTDKAVRAEEVVRLLASVGWGDENDYDLAAVGRSLDAYPLVVYARDRSGSLVGYVTAFSDGAFSTFIGELAVRPEFQGQGLGSELLRRVEVRYPGIPVYVQTFTDVQGFFQRNGYRAGRKPQCVMFKMPVPV